MLKIHTQDDLLDMKIKDGKEYRVKYENKDYFNSETTVEVSRARAIFQNNKIIFCVTDPYGMERFIEKVEVLK